LFDCYDDAVALLQEEIEACRAGDTIVLSVWILEPGQSSQAVLNALKAAAERGCDVEVSVDGTKASLVQRLWERTVTLLPEVRQIASTLDRFTSVERTHPDHCKYALFVRPGRPTVTLCGGINLGDRFRPWRDYALRLEGALAADLVAKVRGEGEGYVYPPPPGTLTLVANVPTHDIYEIRTAFVAIMKDPAVRRLRIAMAYLDRVGAHVLRHALDRGAALDLLLPLKANVYHQANMKALRTILHYPTLRVFQHPEMLHAKLLQAEGEEGVLFTYFGSANLKRYSLHVLGELNLLVTLPDLNRKLETALDGLFAESQQVTKAPGYRRVQAIFEENLG
jgi:phosphatidylserine/phosphatidylglycerophosphate/cardiolipin synthase-like enzyme